MLSKLKEGTTEIVYSTRFFLSAIGILHVAGFDLQTSYQPKILDISSMFWQCLIKMSRYNVLLPKLKAGTFQKAPSKKYPSLLNCNRWPSRNSKYGRYFRFLPCGLIQSSSPQWQSCWPALLVNINADFLCLHMMLITHRPANAKTDASLPMSWCEIFSMT